MTEVQQRILNVASKLFNERGYQDVSLRQIADEAKVNASIIIRHFGSKDRLFILSMKNHGDKDDILSGPRENLGEAIVKKIIDSSKTPQSPARNMAIFLRAITNENLKQEMRESTERTMIKPLSKLFDGPDKELRASLVVAQISGLLVHISSLEDIRLDDGHRQKVITHYGKAIQSLIDN